MRLTRGCDQQRVLRAGGGRGSTGDVRAEDECRRDLARMERDQCRGALIGYASGLDRLLTRRIQTGHARVALELAVPRAGIAEEDRDADVSGACRALARGDLQLRQAAEARGLDGTSGRRRVGGSVTGSGLASGSGSGSAWASVWVSWWA